jgi:hypothetical protein
MDQRETWPDCEIPHTVVRSKRCLGFDAQWVVVCFIRPVIRSDIRRACRTWCR